MCNNEWGNIELPGLSDEKLLATNWNRVTAGRANANNTKLLELAELKKGNADFSQTMCNVAEQRNKDPQYQQAHRQGMSKRDNSYQAEVNARPDKRAATSAKLKGRKKSDEHLAKVAARNRERSKRIQTPHGEFESRKAAVLWHQENTDILNVDKKIQKWVMTLGSGYHYL